MKKYRSATDVWMLLLLFIPMAYPVYEGIATQDLGLVLTFAGITAFIGSLFLTITYIITEDTLIVGSGIFGKQKIAIADITSVCKSYNPLSAPALSINRLEIKYGQNYDYTLISPVRREEFVAELLKINPNIKVEI
ncbi:MAG: PH domain-containing protein [Flavobacterium sp.]